MTLDLAILRLADRLAAYAGARHGVLAENIANADTPGYRARDLAPFAAVWADGTAPLPAGTRAPRPGHLALDPGPAAPFAALPASEPGTASPNGNSVGLEDQMMRAAELRLQHDLALGIYQSSLRILRLGLGRAR
jgi:flagellar basal-body rod protein FlgB